MSAEKANRTRTANVAEINMDDNNAKSKKNAENAKK